MLWRPVLAVAGIWYAVVIAVGLPPEAHFLIYAFAGAALITLAAYPTRATAGALVLGAGLLLPLHVAARDTFDRALTIEPGFFLAYLGLAAVVVLSIRAFREPLPKDVVLGAVGIPTFVFLTEPFHTVVIHTTPRTLDPVLYRLDAALFGDLTLATGRLLARHAWLHVASVWCYAALALAGAGIYALALRGRAGNVRPRELLWAWAAAGVIGGICYFVVPAVGPRWVFPEWPWRALDVSGDYAVPLAAVPRNAMPSLHATWALLVCWGGRESPVWLRCILVPWLALTLLATLGAGGHYFIDLVAAVPLTLAAAWLGVRARGTDGRESRRVT